MNKEFEQPKKLGKGKKILIGIGIFIVVIVILSQLFPIDYYKDGIDYYNKQNYVKALDYFNQVKPEDKYYQDAINKIKEIKPIVDSLAASKKKAKDNVAKSDNNIKSSPVKAKYNKVGDQIEVDKFSYVINNYRFAKTVGNEFSQVTADGIFLIVDLTFRNNDDKQQTLDNSFFKLTNESGTEFSSSSDGESALEMSGKETLFLKECNPQIQKSGLLIFEVPEKNVYDLHLSGGFWNDNTVAVRLISK